MSAEAPRELSVLIVDDEAVARRRLRRMLAAMRGVRVSGEAADGDEALERIAGERPALVLLDIRMPGMDGLELAERLPDGIHVVFTTAFDEYAVRAFEAAAIDYLLKPIERERLEEALERVRRLESHPEREDLKRIVREITGRQSPPRVSARRGDAIQLFDPRRIARFHSEDGYTVFRHEGKSYLLDESIVALAARLESWGFVRVHRAELVNLHHVKALRRVDDATVVELADGQRATVSRRHLPKLKNALGIR